MPVDLKKIFDQLKKRFTPGKLEKDVTYYFSLGEDDDSKWTVVAGPKKCAVKQGKVDNADCVLKTTSDIFVKMIEEAYVPGGMDVITGRVKVSSIPLLKQLSAVFRLGEAAGEGKTEGKPEAKGKGKK